VHPVNIAEYHIKIESPGSSVLSELSQYIASQSIPSRDFTLSNAQLKQAIDKGALWLTRGKSTQRLRRVKKALLPLDELHFYYNETLLTQVPAPATLIADCQHYSVWFKPYGMLSLGSKWSDHFTIERWVQKSLVPERPVFIVHRLDKAATGLIVVAHSKKATTALSAMFEAKSIEQSSLQKQYQIIVHGNASELAENTEVITPIEEKHAKSIFTCQAYDAQHNLSLIQVNLITGRKHQIRIHAASVGLPVVGDRLHGDPKIYNKEYSEALNLQLCSVSLQFTCPFTGEEKSFTAPEDLRPDIKKVIQRLKS
jgi:tRNA pseudouridine32 synthase/23S rRNA pseudouridine746 synthase